MATMSKPTLTSLPAELRLKIYLHLFSVVQKEKLVQEPPLMLTCHLIWSEMMKPYYDALEAEQGEIAEENRALLDREDDLLLSFATHSHQVQAQRKSELAKTKAKYDLNFAIRALLIKKAKKVLERAMEGSY